MKFFLIFTVLLVQEITAKCGDPIVNTVNGKVEGILETSVNNRTYASFYCIPYAQAPVGSLRFQAPVAAKKWSSTLSTKEGIKCPQYFGNDYSGQEDCLCLNVFIPAQLLHTKKQYPVIVYIHGGAFMYGSAEEAGPDYLMDRDVILVAMNYRLGALGFLSTEDDVIAGNMGLKDQLLALKWVKDNIYKFSGNPNDVTLMGFSAGGASVLYHYLTKSSRNLFNAAVCLSGVALNPWALQNKPLRKAMDLSKILGCNVNNTNDIKNCLNKKSDFDITTAVIRNQFTWQDLPMSPYAPVIEKNCKNSFLCKHPYKILNNEEKSDIPIIYATVKNEAMGIIYPWLNDNATLLNHLEQNWQKLCPAVFNFENTLSPSEQQTACSRIKENYLNNLPVSEDTFLQLTDAVTHRLCSGGIEKSAKIHAKFNKNVYLYLFNYYSLTQSQYGIRPKRGIWHGDDLYMIFSQKTADAMDASDKHVQDVLLDLVLSLSNGSPETSQINTIWTPVNKSGDLNYLYFGNDTIEMKSSNTISSADFWQTIPFEENENVV